MSKKGPPIFITGAAIGALCLPLTVASLQTSGMRETEIAVGEFIFDAAVAGPEDGDLVVMLHGFPQSWYEYRDQIPILARMGFRVVAIRICRGPAKPNGTTGVHVGLHGHVSRRGC